MHQVLIPRRYEHLMLERTHDRTIIYGHSIITHSNNMLLCGVAARRLEYLTIVRRVCRWHHVLEEIARIGSLSSEEEPQQTLFNRKSK